MDMEIRENAVYTTAEAKNILKISESTIKRLLKREILKANKVGGQYRILGKEMLRLVSPNLERKAVDRYLGFKKKVTDTINKW